MGLPVTKNKALLKKNSTDMAQQKRPPLLEKAVKAMSRMATTRSRTALNLGLNCETIREVINKPISNISFRPPFENLMHGSTQVFKWSPTGKPVVPLRYPSSRSDCVSASHGATTRLSASALGRHRAETYRSFAHSS